MNKKDKPVKEQQAAHSSTLTFTRINYILLVVGLVFLFAGYVLMTGGGSEDPAVFSDKIFDKRRLNLAPILLIIGFAIEAAAILYHPKK
jgi:hypothetical protein